MDDDAVLVLDYLSAAATATYLRQRCGVKLLPPGLPQLFQAHGFL